jgi:hypothetical protein
MDLGRGAARSRSHTGDTSRNFPAGRQPDSWCSGDVAYATLSRQQAAERGESLLAVLGLTRQGVGAVDWSSWRAALADLDGSYATLESIIAGRTGQRLRLPR